MPAVAGASKYCPHPFGWPSELVAIRPIVGTAEELADQAKAAPVTAVGAGVAVRFAPPAGATPVLWTCVVAMAKLPAATVAPQVLAVVVADHAPAFPDAFVAWTSTSMAAAPDSPLIL